MGALVPFPTCRAHAQPAGGRVMPDSPAEVIILPVVQYVRPAPPPSVTVAGATRDPR